jgi:hypothetical protein
MRNIFLATLLLVAATVSSGFARADIAASAPASQPSTAGWSNAELQGDGQVVGKRHTFDVQQAMRQPPKPEMVG